MVRVRLAEGRFALPVAGRGLRGAVLLRRRDHVHRRAAPGAVLELIVDGDAEPEFAQLVRRDSKYWGALIRSTGFTLEQ